MGRTCCGQKLISTFRTIYVHNMFSSCSAKIRASDKDLPVQLEIGAQEFGLKISKSPLLCGQVLILKT